MGESIGLRATTPTAEEQHDLGVQAGQEQRDEEYLGKAGHGTSPVVVSVSRRGVRTQASRRARGEKRHGFASLYSKVSRIGVV